MHPLFLVPLLAAVAGDPAAAWPGFLGAGADPIAADSLPLSWSPTENVAWKAALPGHGQSSPVIDGDDVFVTAVEGPQKDTCHLICLSLADGREKWRRSIASTAPVKNSLYVSRAAPTPVVDADRVYAFFESGDLLAVGRDGREAWSRSLSRDYGAFDNEFGLAASPAQAADRLFLLVDHKGPSYVLAVSKADGRTLWKRDRTSRVSWSSPAVVTIDGVAQLVCSSAGSVDAYDLATGETLWSLGDLGGNTAATPVAFDGGRFLVGASPGQEGQHAATARRSNLAMTARRRGAAWEPEVLWRTDKALPSFGSPVVHGNVAYWVNRAGVVIGLDAATGTVHYEERAGESVWATPLGVGDRVYLFGKNGTTTVIAAGPAWKVLATNRLWDPDEVQVDPAAGAAEDTEEKRRGAAMFAGRVQYGVAAVSGSLLVRTGDVLYCVRSTAATAAADTATETSGGTKASDDEQAARDQDKQDKEAKQDDQKAAAEEAALTPTEKLPPLPVAASSLGVVESGGQIYVYGGHVAPVHTYSTTAVTGTFMRMPLANPAAWEPLPGGPALQGLNLAAHRGRIYRVGGMEPRNAPDTPSDNWSVASVACFDPATQAWTNLPPLPVPRSSHDVAVVGDTLYVVGGWNMLGAAGGEEWCDTMLALDLNAPDRGWKELPQPFMRRALISAVAGGRLHVIGGFTDSDEVSPKVDVFDPATGQWSAGPDLPDGEFNGFSAAACTVDGAIHVSVADGGIHRLSADGRAWEAVAKVKPRIVHRAVADGPGHIVLVGGARKSANLDLVERVPVR